MLDKICEYAILPEECFIIPNYKRGAVPPYRERRDDGAPHPINNNTSPTPKNEDGGEREERTLGNEVDLVGGPESQNKQVRC